MLNINGKALLKITNSQTHTTTMLKSVTGETNNNDTVINETLGSLALYVGNDNTAPTADDYTMDTTNLGLTVVATTGTNDSTAGSYTQNYIAIFNSTFRNDTNADITVSEVGIIGSGRGPFSNPKTFLIARDVLSTPVTITPGEAYTFTMYIG